MKVVFSLRLAIHPGTARRPSLIVTSNLPSEHSSDPTLLLLLDEVRHKTLQRLEGVADAEARWTPAGLQNHILWHAGHAYVVSEWLPMDAIGSQPVCPKGWFDLFSWNSQPGEASDDDWPPLSEVVDQLRVQHGRLRKMLCGLSAEFLDQPARNRPECSVRERIMHALRDEASHSGEVWLLRKMQRNASS